MLAEEQKSKLTILEIALFILFVFVLREINRRR
jgi:hypothetical protein